MNKSHPEAPAISNTTSCDATAAGGAWRRSVLGPVVVCLFLLQVGTGVLLMTVYSPSTTTAWGSVWYIQTQVPAGWLIRGMHHFASDAMLALLALHALQIVLSGLYRGTGAAVWWLTLGLVAVALALSVSGHLLPWDQGGYWGTKVRVNILARTPLIGDALRRLLIGGNEFGHLTLTHFYTLHVVALTGAAGTLIWGRMVMLRRGRETIATTEDDANDQPQQALRASLACAVVVAILFAIVWYSRSVLGMNLLDAPADPTTSDYPARPEWHTLFLYQGLKYFQGPTMELLGAIVVPSTIAMTLFAFPCFDRFLRPALAHRFVVALTAVLIVGAGWLTYGALRADVDPSEAKLEAIEARRSREEHLTEADQAVLRARQFNQRSAQARRLARRAMVLADVHGIPPEGPLSLLANDAVTRGPILFAANCAVCHRYDGHDGAGGVPTESATSSDLAGYATRSWVRGLLSDPMDDKYFGRMTKPDGDAAHTRMSRWIREVLSENEGEEERRALDEEFDAVAAYLEDESLRPRRFVVAALEDAPASTDDTLIRRGRQVFLARCNECHSYDGERSGTLKAPEMAGYGSIAWIEAMIADPSHDTRYRSRGREPAQMPAFKDRLAERDRRLIAQWLHGSRGLD